MKEEKLLRTEFYRTRSVGTKTESVNPNTPRIWRQSFLRRLRLLGLFFSQQGLKEFHDLLIDMTIVGDR
jgi:hypothetical protein